MPVELENVMIESCEGFEQFGSTFEEVDEALGHEFDQWLDMMEERDAMATAMEQGIHF